MTLNVYILSTTVLLHSFDLEYPPFFPPLWRSRMLWEHCSWNCGVFFLYEDLHIMYIIHLTCNVHHFSCQWQKQFLVCCGIFLFTLCVRARHINPLSFSCLKAETDASWSTENSILLSPWAAPPPFLFPLALLHIYMCCCYVSLLNTRNRRGIRPCKCHSPFIALPLRNPGTLCTCALLGLIWFFWWEWEVTEMLQLQRKNAVSSPSQVFCTLHFLKSPEWKDRKS